MGPIGDRIVNADSATIQFHAIKLFDASGSFLGGRHRDETEASGPVRLALVIDNDYFFNTTKPTELVVEVALNSSDTEAEHT